MIEPVFSGLTPWPANIEVTECMVEGRLLDLHNSCTVIEIALPCTPAHPLVLRLLEDASNDRWELVFGEITDLTVTSEGPAAVNWSAREVETFIGVEYTLSDDRPPHFSLETITATCAFDCRTVELRRI